MPHRKDGEIQQAVLMAAQQLARRLHNEGIERTPQEVVNYAVRLLERCGQTVDCQCVCRVLTRSMENERAYKHTRRELVDE